MSDPDFWVCPQCQQPFLSRCPAHGPPLLIQDSPAPPGHAGRALRSAPPGLRVGSEGGQVEVRCGAQRIPQGAVFGPYEGELVPRDRSTAHSWIIVDVNNSYHSIDGSDETKANWMRYVRISSENTERNLTAFQRGGQLYFSASRPLLPGNRLRVWYGDDYITRLHSLSEQSIDCSLHPGSDWRRGGLQCWRGPDGEAPPAADRTETDSASRRVQAFLESQPGLKPLSGPPPSRLGKRRRLSAEALRPVKVEEEEEQEQSSTSSCPNCIKLRLRIFQLEAELHLLRGKEMDPATPPNPEQGPIEDLRDMDPLTPSQMVLDEEDQDLDSADESFNADPLISAGDSSKLPHRRTRRFKQEWLRKFWFLRYSPALNEMWCHVCRQYTVQSARTSAFIMGSKQFKIHTIKLHSQSNLHKKCLQLYKLRMHPEKTEEMCRSMTVLFNAAYHLAVEGRPFSDLRPLAELLRRCELKVVEQYLNEGDCQILVHHIARTLREDLAEKMRLSPFLSVLMDCQNEDLFPDTVAFYVQFTTNDGSPNTEFLSLQKLSQASADGYLQAIERAFCVFGLRFQDLLVVGVGMDGAPMSTGMRGSMFVALQRVLPWLLSLPVMIHRPHLEVLDVISGKELSCLEDLENNLKQLLGFYRYSPRMMAELRLTAPTLSEEMEFLGDIRAVRWIIGEPNVVNALIKDYLEVVGHLKDVSRQTQKADAAAVALTLLHFLLDYQSVKLIYFLLDVIAVLSRLAFTFQGDYLLVSQVNDRIEESMVEIGQLVDRPGEYLQEFEENFRESFNGVALKNLCVAESKFQAIREKICRRSQGILSQRLDPLSSPLARACRVLDFSSWPRTTEDLHSYGDEEILLIFNHLESIPSVPCEGQARSEAQGNLLVEWRSLKADFCSIGSKELLGHLCKHRQRFPLLCRVAQLVQVLPTSTVCCERGRGSLQKMYQNSRSRLGLDPMNDLLTLAINGPPIASFDGKRALDSWFEEKSGSSSLLSAEIINRISKSQHESSDANTDILPDT
ncbi:zinc finger protein 862 isoform X2 [Gadus chalcogrammus]|nr:zinc finger protein 862 isoform X2 [Gadus chalcogrammus]